MHRLRALAVVGLSLALLAPCAAAQRLRDRLQERPHVAYAEEKGLLLHAVVSGGQARWYRVYLPSSYDEEASHPVVFCFHGGGGNAQQAAMAYGVVEEAEARGWVAVFPEGTGKLGGPPLFAIETWNTGTCCGYAHEHEVDDVQFFADALDDLADRYAVDRARVFATGMSNGGMMSYAIAVERPDLVAGVAPVAGALMTHAAPSAPVPLLAIHGLLDENVPFEGGVGSGVSKADFTGQEASVLPFLQVNGGPMPSAPFVHGAAQLYVSPGPPDGSDTWYLLALDGGHTWPCGMPAAIDPKEPLHADVPATPLMFDFFERQFPGDA